MRCVHWLAVFLALGCGQGAANPAHAEPEPSGTDSDSTASSLSASDSTGVGTATSATETQPTSSDASSDVDLGPPPCAPGPGTSGSPTTVIEVVELINGLPHPVTIPCFLQALERPLRILGAASFISAQPADGRDNPRLFILGDGISLSVVADGTGKDLLEMGELTSNTHSIKGELLFPITEPLSLDAALAHIRSEVYGGTVCFGCHHSETEVLDYPAAGAFDSVAYRPLPELEVDLAVVRDLFTSCDATLEPARCEFYDALFKHGEVVPGRFPDEMPLFQ